MLDFRLQPAIDIQKEPDQRGIALLDVGIAEVAYPILVPGPAWQGWQPTNGEFALSVDLPAEQKGTHMSRFMEMLADHDGAISPRTLPLLLSSLQRRLGSSMARIEVEFKYFLERTAPASGKRAKMHYDCALVAQATGPLVQQTLRVTAAVGTLCPCSKAISARGAHNQRGHVTMEVRAAAGAESEPDGIWIDDLVAVAEGVASAPLYPLLKRSDEKYVTEQAYDNPRFVEDMVRGVALGLQRDARVAWFWTKVVNQESIHNHVAWAQYEWTRAHE